MNDLKSVIENLKTRFSNNSTYSYWLRFTSGSLVLDTSTNKNLFVSLENRKSGVKKANCFTLNIAYKPSESYTENKFGDPNYIDKCLATIPSGGWMTCTLQYGYDYGPDGLMTGRYSGLITDYTKEISNGFLLYTITGYSNLIENAEDKVSINTMTNMRATEAAKKVLEEHIDRNIYSVEIDKSALNMDEIKPTIAGISEGELFLYVDTILKSAVDSNSKDSDADSMSYYTYVVVDEETCKKIKIIRVDANTYKSDATIVFNWMDKRNSIVQNFKPNYSGAVLYSYYNGLREKSVVVTEGGDQNAEEGIKDSPIVASVASEDIRIEKSTWAEAIRTIPYTATLITMGIPYEVPILTNFRVVPLIFGIEDMSAGVYMVLNVVDNLDNNGFITTFDLARVGSINRNNFGKG